jgi:lysozyme family protein
MKPPSRLETQRAAMIDFIVSVEARRDPKTKRLRVYKLPPADGGGTFEVAGINDRFHPHMAHHLRSLIATGDHAQAEIEIRAYLADYTAIAITWSAGLPAVEAILRDCTFNRGPRGALRILQLAVNVADDGRFGPITRAALKDAARDPRGLLKRLRSARERYERRIAPPVGARAKFWNGLRNRWGKAHAFAITLL